MCCAPFLASDSSKYAYVGGQPTRYTDSRGLFLDELGVYTGVSTAATATGTSAAAAASGIGSAAVVGVGIGYGINAAWEHLAGQPLGSSLYDLLHPDQATRDPDLQREIEKTANQREAHRICDEPPPPGLTHRELARWNLTKMLRCKQARNNLSNKWFGGPDQDHIDHITNNVDPAIERYRNAVDKLCKPGCNK